MIKVKKEGVILKPTSREFESLSAFNPGVYQIGQDVHLFYRALTDNHVSSIGYARLKGPLEVVERWKKPYMSPQYKYEKCGIEDPRIVKIKDTFYLTYVVHDGKNALIAYSYGPDLFKLKKGGIISPQLSYNSVGDLFNYSKLDDKYYFYKSYYIDTIDRNVLLWDKDGFLFPQKIKRKFALVHRILPEIQVAYFNNFEQLKDNKFWEENIKNLSKHVVLEAAHGFESRNIGGGAPPIKTKAGWLLIYHGVTPMNKGRVYHAAAALLDLKDPTKVLGRLPYPLFSPEEEWEHQGHVHNVVFPTGTAIFKDQLYIYYGASDTYTAAASVNLPSLIKEILKYKNRKKLLRYYKNR
jgi:beta-1,2-mannobiose phosphorylase / 1,2-beta-oligomannan phosphorylase